MGEKDGQRLSLVKETDDKRKAKAEWEPVAIKTRTNQHKNLTVHIVAHTHDDVGWVKTVDDYYTGMRGKDSHARVEQILDEVVSELLSDPKKLFTFVEMKFFNMWYIR